MGWGCAAQGARVRRPDKGGLQASGIAWKIGFIRCPEGICAAEWPAHAWRTGLQWTGSGWGKRLAWEASEGCQFNTQWRLDTATCQKQIENYDDEGLCAGVPATFRCVAGRTPRRGAKPEKSY